ncbi:tigger transposable element-derived protein 6-like [Aphis gossypii]|uniref:tigger transposable element-derived protein 6-like n=1 Tax=Aphis gossypii TaxID=80765 RepID=UPI0021599F10|nr:tigger transposable element-derived protein 6-like [Aphis gossypii]
MLAMLSRLSIGLDRNAPVASLAPALLIVSSIFRAFLLALIKRNALYSSLDNMRDLCIIDRNWFVAVRAKNIPVSGPIIQEKAREIAVRHGNHSFKASNGWLSSFKNKHYIAWNRVCGESNDVNIDSVNEWKLKISEYVKDYDACNIYNCDETGLFFRAIPNKTLKLKGEQCKGGKLSKERLTVLLCGNMAGDMEKSPVIGKSVKPRCFKITRHLMCL